MDAKHDLTALRQVHPATTRTRARRRKLLGCGLPGALLTIASLLSPGCGSNSPTPAKSTVSDTPPAAKAAESASESPPTPAAENAAEPPKPPAWDGLGVTPATPAEQTPAARSGESSGR